MRGGVDGLGRVDPRAAVAVPASAAGPVRRVGPAGHDLKVVLGGHLGRGLVGRGRRLVLLGSVVGMVVVVSLPVHVGHHLDRRPGMAVRRRGRVRPEGQGVRGQQGRLGRSEWYSLVWSFAL